MIVSFEKSEKLVFLPLKIILFIPKEAGPILAILLAKTTDRKLKWRQTAFNIIQTIIFLHHLPTILGSTVRLEESATFSLVRFCFVTPDEGTVGGSFVELDGCLWCLLSAEAGMF